MYIVSIALFRAAEELGCQSGWCYQRHFDNYLSAPMPFFAAVAQHMQRITLGSADLLAGGRLQLAVAQPTSWSSSSPAFHLQQNLRLLADMARHVGPALGWPPAG